MKLQILTCTLMWFSYSPFCLHRLWDQCLSGIIEGHKEWGGLDGDLPETLLRSFELQTQQLNWKGWATELNHWLATDLLYCRIYTIFIYHVHHYVRVMCKSNCTIIVEFAGSTWVVAFGTSEDCVFILSKWNVSKASRVHC